MNNSWKRFLSLLLAMVMVLSLGVTGFADEGEAEEAPAEIAEDSVMSTEEEEGEDPAEEPAEDAVSGDMELEMEEISPDKLHVRKLGLEEDLDEIVPMDGEDLDTVVRASIFLDSPSTLSAGYSAKGVGTNAEAIAYRDGLKAQQDAMTAQIESVIGHKLNVHWNMTLAMNAISADLSLGEMVKVKEIPGVRSVERENQYLPMDEGSISDPETANTSENMVGAATAWAAGFTGAGSKIAIVDTGIDTSHQSFAADPFTYSVNKAGATGELMTESQVSALAGQLNSKSGNYVSAKIPYGYNYVDENTTITHVGDTEGNHGSHVAGIAAANRYIKSGSSYVEAATQVGAVGMAPDAQLFVMKVFGASGGAYDSDYMVAIEDAIVLGADVCNLSLGSGAPGWSFDNSYQSYLNGWANGEHNDDMVLTISAGNSYSATDFAASGTPYIEDVYTHTGGSPGSFVNSLCVAAAQNTLTTGTPMQFNGNLDVFYYESTGNEEEGTTYTNPELVTIAGSYQYVYIDSVGTAEEFRQINDMVGLSGKVVIVNRGELSFVEKGENAKSYNPKALIIANSKSGTIHMDLTDFTGTFPMVTITLDSAQQIKAGSSAISVDGLTYYTGNMKVTDTEKSVVIDRSEATITDFSSWGVPGSLLMKPEITAPGGDIYSVNGTAKTSGGSTGGADQYVSYSGTSMAAPHMAGLAAVLAERIREEDVRSQNQGLGSYSIRAIAQSLLMSTSTPMAPKNSYISILQQGAGLADVSLATTANSVIMMDPSNSGLTGLTGAAADGKVKVELGDDPDRKGDYSFGFTVYNLTDDDMVFDVTTDVFTQASDGELMLRGTSMLDASATKWWAPLDGSAVPNEHDVNKDGKTDRDDAQAILDFLSGETEKEKLDLSVADLDGDTDVTTLDAYQLLGFVSEKEGDTQDGLVPARGSRYCAVRIKLPENLKNSLTAEFPGGAFIEGFTYVSAVGTTRDGAVYTDEHSIPILGFYGSWTDATMFETTSYVETLYGSEQLPYSGNRDTNYMKLQMNGSSVRFSGNPYMVEEQFPAERLAINSNTTMQSIAYNLIRSAGTTGYAVSKLQNGQVSEVLNSSIVGNNVTGLWYYVNQGSWQNTTMKSYSINKTPASYGLAENDTFRVGFYAIPEYNAMLVNKSYDAGSSGVLSQAGFNTLLTDNVLGKGAFVGYDFVVDNTDPRILSATLNGNTLTVKTEDNQNLAYVAVMSLDGETIYKEAAPANPTCDLSVDASEAIANAHGYVAVFAGDYAGNEAAMAVKVNNNTWEEKTLYVLSDTLTAGEDYLIVNTNTTGTGYALGYTAGSWSNTITSNEVIVRTGDYTSQGKLYIRPEDVSDTAVWTAGSGVKLSNNGNYLKRNSRTGTTLEVSETDNYNTWQYSGGQLRFTDKATYLRFYNNSFSLTTAASSIYLFQKTVIRSEVDPYSVSSVTLTADSLELYKGSTADLTAKVLPLTAEDRTITWSSSNPSVATVDQAGKITAVSAGTTADNQHMYSAEATIRATSNANNAVFAECKVKVVSFEKALNGIVWDEAGSVFFSSFNTNTLPSWNADSGAVVDSNDAPIYLSNAYMADANTLYASTCDLSSDGTLYTVSSNYGLTEKGVCYVPAFGMARVGTSFGTGYTVFGFAKYIIFGNIEPEAVDEDDPSSDQYSLLPMGLLDLSTTNVGDAYVAAVCARTISTTSATYFILDETGKIWQTSQSYSSSKGITFSAPTLVVDTGIGTSVQYQSLYYDGTYLYWSHQTDNETEMIIIQPTTKQVYHAGNFGEGVWPVGGLYVNGHAAPYSVGDEPVTEAIDLRPVATREELMTPDVIERLSQILGMEVATPEPENEEQEPAEEGSIEDGEGTIAPVEEPIIEPVPADDGQNSAYLGGLTAFRGTVGAAPRVHTAEPQAADDNTIAIDISEIEASHNGLISVVFYPELVSLASWTDCKNASNLSVHVDESDGKTVVTIAYANKDAAGDDIAKGEAIITLIFSVEDESALECGEIASTITLERNAKLELDEQSDVILPGNPGHDWGDPTWVWADDFSYADAEFVCKHDATHTASVSAELTKETADGVTTYTATAVFQGKTYTDTKTETEVVPSNITSCSTSFNGKLRLNVYIVLSEEIAADPDAYVSVTFDSETTKHSVPELLKSIDSQGRVKVKQDVFAPMMREDIKLQVFNGKNEAAPLTYKETTDVTAGFTYNVLTYLKNRQENSTNTKMVELARAAELYGIAAQVYFSYGLDQLTEGEIAEMKAAAAELTIPAEYDEKTSGTLPAGITRRAKTVMFEADNSLRMYFYLDDADLDKYTFTLNGVEVTPVKKESGRYYVEQPDVASPELSIVYTFTVSDGVDTFTAECSVLGYAYGRQQNSSNTNMVNLAKLLYRYSMAANDYFG